MSKTKNVLTLWLVAVIAMMGCARWAKVTFQPLFSDVRFQPADKLHAGCPSSADILFSPQGQKVTKFTLVFYYNPETIEILRILPSSNNGIASSKIEYDKIILEVQNPSFASSTSTASFFQLYFKSDIVGQDVITLGTGSEALVGNKTYPLSASFVLDFAKVPECEPDIIPPSINLIYPKDTTQRIMLDQYFIFDIKDIGKWVDKNNVIVSFDKDQYTYGSDNLKWNGNYLTFYPGKWIPINKKIDLKISVTDKQSYGWANTTDTTYVFQSATGMLLNKNISPMMFRQIVQEAGKISASTGECLLLANFYGTSAIKYQQHIKSIIQKLWCDLTSLDPALLASGDISSIDTSSDDHHKKVSVFATIWWLLFFVVFGLKIHYLFAYKKHKKNSR